MKYEVRMIGGVGRHDLDEVDETGEAIYMSAGQQRVVKHPLHTLFPDKFVLIAEVSEAGEKSAPAKPAKKAAKKAPETVATALDISDRFPSAGTAGLTVVSENGMFSILRGEDVLVAGLANEALVVSEIDDLISSAVE